jgi:AcrR family transcriptional regulator
MTEVRTRRNRGALRTVAGREQILAAARSIGVRKGCKSVTIRAVAQRLGYTSPLLYEHFRDKEDILTQLAIEGQLSLAKDLAKELPEAPDAAVLLMVERYWSFMLKNKQIYRLMNGMALIDELWAVLHGMAALSLDRAVPFDLERAQDCVGKLLLGTRMRMQRLRG